MKYNNVRLGSFLAHVKVTHNDSEYIPFEFFIWWPHLQKVMCQMLWRIRIYTYCCISSIYVFLTQRKITCWDLVRFCLLVIFRVFIYSDCLCRKFGVNGRRYLPPACVLLKLHTINKSRNPCCQCTITGIPISRPVAGVACGIVTSSDAQDPNKSDIEQYRLMTDILVRSVFSIHLSVHEITSFRNLQNLRSQYFCAIWWPA